MAKVDLNIVFCTDGDYHIDFENIEFEAKSPLYHGAEIDFATDHRECEYKIRLICEGDADGCRWAVRDILEMVAVSIRVSYSHYYVLGSLYKMIVYPLEERRIWNPDGFEYYEEYGGNYEGTEIELKITLDEETRDGN